MPDNRFAFKAGKDRQIDLSSETQISKKNMSDYSRYLPGSRSDSRSEARHGGSTAHHILLMLVSHCCCFLRQIPLRVGK
eukprot:6212546-Pleurochrysis_carterae.AAC.2